MMCSKDCINYGSSNIKCLECSDGNNFKHTTQADRIRSMSDEELEQMLHNFSNSVCDFCSLKNCGVSCRDGVLEWLQSEVEE